MSRIIIRNLPKKISEQKLREIFSEVGTITDLQLKYAKDGKFRQFAFVGYKEESEADKAVETLNNITIKTSVLSLEKCASLGDSLQKSKSNRNFEKKTPKIETPQKVEKKSKQQEIEELLEKYKDDPVFEEFLQVQNPKFMKIFKKIQENKTTNQTVDKDEEIDTKNEDENVEEEKIANEAISDLEYMKKLMGVSDGGSETKQQRPKQEKQPKQITLFTVMLRGVPEKCKKKDLKEFFKPLKPFTIRIPPKNKGIIGVAYVGFKKQSDFKKALIKDRSFINGKQILVKELKETTNKSETKPTIQNEKWREQEEGIKDEDIADSGKIFYRNLSYTVTEDDVEKLFSTFGTLAEINLPVDPDTLQNKGFGTVTFVLPENAVSAYSTLDGTTFQGRYIHLMAAKTKDEDNKDSNDLEEGTNFKRKKAAKQKAEAGSSHNWNSLFLGHDAVASAIAEKYKMSKEDVLDPHGDSNAAVRLALGETQIVTQTKKYLEQEGVLLDAFTSATAKRSKTVLLVKNLPSRTEAKEIRDMFTKYGTLGRVILPPSGISCVVEFVVSSEAKNAYKNLAYTKFKNTPLYLEWAPENSLSERQNNNSETKDRIDNNKNEEDSKEKTNEVEKEDEEEDEEPEPDTTLFVKNLNFKTTKEDLRRHFEICGKIYEATVATKKNPSNPSETLSMGFGFVRFYTKNSANSALKSLQQSDLDGKTLELKRSERILTNELKSAKKSSKKTNQTGTKILVRNVPFQANRKDLLELFSAFGELRALRLPKKMSLDENSHSRGFAFIDYTNSTSAKQAFEALSQSTHLFGRRLVLEWAKTEESVDEIRKRTADQFLETTSAKKTKKSVANFD